MNYVAGGVGKALIFLGNQLRGVANTLSNNTFDFSITAEDIRGGKKNVLLGQYFHDSNLSIELVNALFNYDEIAMVLGSTIQQGGLSIKEEQVVAGVGGVLVASQEPVATAGSIIGWYKRPADTMWSVGSFTEQNMTTSGIAQGEVVCIKYFWNNPDARSFDIKADYEPAEVHLVILQDLFGMERQSGVYQPGAKAGTLITDIPRFKLNGTLNLGFEAGSTATTSLAGNALAVVDDTNCEESFIYGTMTEEIIGETWENNVIALALEDSELSLKSGEKATLAVRVIYGNSDVAERKDNSNFDFVITSPDATSSNVGLNTGDFTAGATAGTCYVTVTLKDNREGPSAIAEITVTTD